MEWEHNLSFLSRTWNFRGPKLQSNPVSWSSVSQNCVSLSCKKTHCKLIRMRNWFWLRSSHPFSLFTPLQSKFSSSLQNVLVSAVFCTLSARYLWLLMLTVKACSRRWRNHSLMFYISRPQPSTPALRSNYDRLLNSLFPAAIWPLFHFQVLSLPALSPGMIFPLESGQRCFLLYWNSAENSEKYFMFSTEILHVLYNLNLNHISLSSVSLPYLPLNCPPSILPLLFYLNLWHFPGNIQSHFQGVEKWFRRWDLPAVWLFEWSQNVIWIERKAKTKKKVIVCFSL